ncbi:hypothetical protein [Micrococcus luteus]|uniref:hypothetical protein n=1 Tax=Micrococcus luteus TaxID=1270 RepID=UPI003641F7C1
MTKVQLQEIRWDPIHVHQPPAFTDPSQVQSPPYRREPYVRVTFPEGNRQDAKAERWSHTHVLIRWRADPGRPPQSAWVPAGWVERIPREDSSWRDAYDLH